MLLFEVPLLGDSVGLVILGSIRFKEWDIQYLSHSLQAHSGTGIGWIRNIYTLFLLFPLLGVGDIKVELAAGLPKPPGTKQNYLIESKYYVILSNLYQ